MAGTKSTRDYYEVLGVSRDAGKDEIERAYRRLALRYHPDRCKESDATQRFKEASEAYAILSDPEKRRRYDTHGFSGVSGYSDEDLFGGIDLGSILGGVGGFNFESSIFDRMFGFGRRQGPVQGANIEATLHVSLKRLLTGGKELIHVKRPQSCSACHGTGAAAGTEPRQCGACGGSGQVTTTRQDKSIRFQQITTCRDCHGRGTLIDHPCDQCKGRGQVERDENIEIQIPPGMDEGRALRVAGHGHPSPEPAGPPGDLFVFVNSAPDPQFQRHGPHLRHTARIQIPEAVLGTHLEVPTLDDQVIDLTIPPGTQPETMFRVPGKGLPISGTQQRGNLYVIVRVCVPEQIDERQRELYEQLLATQSQCTVAD